MRQPGEDYGDQDIVWTRGFFASLDRFRDAVYDRLAGVKARYGPDSVFHHNQNIGPRKMKARIMATW